MHEPSDFRSDTVTRPTAAMRHAMAEAVVGDDVLGDDPTIHELEREVASLLGKDAGLFVPSGSMGNLIAVTCHARPGEEVILEEWAHTVNFEAGGVGRFAGVITRTLTSERGRLDPALVKRWIHPGNLHKPRTALLVVENTHNFHGGSVTPPALMEALRAITTAAGVALHIDGARLWNACAALGVEPRVYGTLADSVTVCLSKGLSAPVGSVLCGTREFVERGRAVRKTLGGAMRQSGILAAAGLVAVRTMRGRLGEDHVRARRIAEGLAAIPAFELEPSHVETNILFARWRGKGAATDAVAAFKQRGLLCMATAPDTLRLLTHADIDDGDCDRLLTAAAEIGGKA
jgi:threonine aldolase